MGTRSRIIIRRKNKPNIHLWMHWDGYFSGQGDRICEQLRNLLQKYSTDALQAKVEDMNLDTNEEYQNFSAEHLEDFVEGRTEFMNDECDDIEYEYTIHFEKGLLMANALNCGKQFVVLFSTIQDGFQVSDLDEYLND
jgi:hypothetical protein